jgi:DNA polymerase-3 subunit gamma/tau
VPISDQVPASESESEFKSGDDSPPFDIDSAEPIDIFEIEPCFQASVENESPVSFEEVDNDQPLIEHDAQDPKDTFPSEMEQVDPAIDFNVEDDVEVTIDIKAFNEQGEKITGSKQVDQWSDVIEKMEVRGLTKQLALHSNYSKTDREVTLLIAEGKSHLNTDIAKAQIKSSLEYVLGTQVDLSITFGVPVNTPFAIQRKINKVRQQYAYQLVERDENIQAFKQQFDATIEMNSTHAR